MMTNTWTRSSGILAHITSLPSPHGIGDLGHSAYNFISFLQTSGQTLWQFLPTVPTSPVFDNSPYMGSSAFAGSPLLISLDLLVEDGLLTEEAVATDSFSEYQTDYSAVTRFKKKLLRIAYEAFSHTDKDFIRFQKETEWLHDFCLFMALKEKHTQKGWFDWPEPIAAREKNALASVAAELQEQIAYFAFEQFVFFKQWNLLRKKAKEGGIRLIGDIPIYVGWDSCDVWANQEIFELNKKSHKPVHVAGVPPDYFSKTGQRWGNPLYRWNSKDTGVKKNLLQWWTKRFRAIFSMVDIVRVDHFRGFQAYWSIPASHKTAMKGKWVKGPGKKFFAEIEAQLGKLNIIAEDLGEITPEVIKLRDECGYPGMKILQFAFDQQRDNLFLPFNYTDSNSVVYTGTHDNDTTVGWYLSDKLTDQQRLEIKRCCNQTHHEIGAIHKDLIYLALSSICNFAILPLQDLLGFGNDCKMNSPGSKEGNWSWRCAARFLDDDIASWLKSESELFGRNLEVKTSKNLK